MYIVVKTLGNFGAHDLVSCKACGGKMALTRRTPQPMLGSKYEEQRFTCPQCQREVFRSVDENGEPYGGEQA